MTPADRPGAPESRGIEAARRLASRGAAVAIAVLLVTGLALLAFGAREPSTTILGAAVVLLILVPVVNVSAVLFEEIRRRDWPFVAAACFVIALVVYSAVDKLR